MPFLMNMKLPALGIPLANLIMAESANLFIIILIIIEPGRLAFHLGVLDP